MEIPLLLSNNAVMPSERARLYAGARRGELITVARGCWVPVEMWTALDAAARHRLRCRALQATTTDNPIFSHLSAAALRRLPLVGEWPERPHVLFLSRGSGRSTRHIVRHGRLEMSSPSLIDGLQATSLLATVVDVASTVSFDAGVVMADAAIRTLVTDARVADIKHDLFLEARRIAPNHGNARVCRVIEFADPKADRPGESLSRVSILRAGLTAPLLQVPLRGASGKEYLVDFFWPEFNVIGEFDGKAKYTDPAFLRGRTAEQAVYDEKLREDDLRAVPYGFTRWKWSTAILPAALGALLRRAGVR